MSSPRPSLPTGLSSSLQLACLILLFLLAPGVAHARVFAEDPDESPDSTVAAADVAGGQDCTVRFEHGTVAISEGLFAVLFVVMDTKTVDAQRRACYEGNITIRHERYANTEANDYTFSGANASGVKTLGFAPINGSHDGTVAYGINVHRNNDDEDGDGDEDEGEDEGLRVSFTHTSYGMGAVTVEDPSEVFIRFTHEGPSTPTLSISGTTVDEGSGSADVRVRLVPASDQTVTVNYATSNGTATSGSDYTSRSSSLTFSAGQTEKTISVPIRNDNVPEGTEDFTVSLSGASGAPIGVGTATVTITDDDGGGETSSLSIGNVTVNEGAGTAQLTVSLSPTINETVTVSYATANVSATAGTDYTASSGSVTFPSNTTTQTITIPITDDTVDRTQRDFLGHAEQPQ